MVSKPIELPDVIDYMYSDSFAMHDKPSNVGPRFGVACSDMKFMEEYYNQELGITPIVIHKKAVGGLMESDCNIVNSAYSSKTVRNIGLFDDERQCSLAYLGVAKASLGSARFRLYYGTAFRLMSDEEHEAYLRGYVSAMTFMEEVEDYHRTKGTIEMLYRHAPFFSDIEDLTDEMIAKGPGRKYDKKLERILEKVRSFRERVL